MDEGVNMPCVSGKAVAPLPPPPVTPSLLSGYRLNSSGLREV